MALKLDELTEQMNRWIDANPKHVLYAIALVGVWNRLGEEEAAFNQYGTMYSEVSIESL